MKFSQKEADAIGQAALARLAEKKKKFGLPGLRHTTPKPKRLWSDRWTMPVDIAMKNSLVEFDSGEREE